MVIDTLSGSGKVISEKAKRISQLLSVDHLLQSDLMLMSRHYPRIVQSSILREELSNDIRDFIVCLEDNYDESREETYKFLINETKRVLDYIRYHYSGAISYGDMREQVLSGVSSDLCLGSMAYEESWDYSKYGHTHDFTKVSMSASYNSPSCLLSCQLSNSTGQIASVGFCIPKEFERPTQYVYDIGEIKLLASPNRTVDVNSSSFDGWVFADGATYSKSDFPSAYEAFKSSSGATTGSFKVPLISGFIRPYPQYGQNLQKVNHSNHVAVHSHGDIDNNQFKTYSKSTSVQLMLPVRYKGSGSTAATAMHTGYTSYYGTMSNLSVEIDSQNFVSSPTTTNKLPAAGEPLPKRNVFSVMVYIGKRGE